MSKTDRQTDRSTAWSLTIYDPGEVALVTNKDSWPHWLRKVKLQEEVCPTTGKHHWQTAMLTQQVRFSAVKKWLPTSHIEVARNKQALLNYVEKDDTAVAGTRQELESEKQYLALHQQLQRLAAMVIENLEEYQAARLALIEEKDKSPDKSMYWWVVRLMLSGEPELAAVLANPALEKMWIHTSAVWIEAAQAASEALSITASPKKTAGLDINEEARKACTVSQEQKDG